MSVVVIKLENIKKQYRLGAIGGGTLTADLQSWWARKRGKEDPNIKIGVDQTRIGDAFYALDGINLEIKQGEKIGIIGANGAGKSTMLKILSRVTAPTEGRIGINGRIASMLEVGTGFHPELTGRENIYMNGAILGMTRKEIDAKIEDIIDFSECRQFIDTPVKRYSSGMYVKLGFAVASHLESEIMIIDEVLAVGDIRFQEKCLGTMGNYSPKENKTILYVSHNMSTIRKLCNRCIVLQHGRIIFDGDVERAIEIYVNAEEDEKDYPAVYDLSETERPSLDHGRLIQLKEIAFVNKKNAIFDNDKPIEITLRWFSEANVENIRFRIRLNCMDGTPIGLAESAIIGDATKGTEGTTRLSWDISNIVAGAYKMVIDLYVLNEYGALRSYDHPGTPIYIRVIDTIGGKDKTTDWDRGSWNSVRLNTIIRMD